MWLLRRMINGIWHMSFKRYVHIEDTLCSPNVFQGNFKKWLLISALFCFGRCYHMRDRDRSWDPYELRE